MIARIHKSMREQDKGFTLIELLVVMIIIGILAAIAIPVFLNQRAKARDTSTKADISTIGKEVATYYVDGTGQLTVGQAAVGGAVTITAPAGSPATFDPINVSAGSDFVQITYAAATPEDLGWCVEMTNAAGQVGAYNYSAQGGLSEGTC